MTTLKLKGKAVQIFTAYENKDKCKSLSSRSWNPAEKCWEAPSSILDEVIRKFPDAVLSEEIKNLMTKTVEIKTMATAAVAKTVLPVKPGLALYPFQAAGVEFLNTVNGNGMVADEMGCIGGDMLIPINRNVKGYKVKLSQLYLKFNDKKDRGLRWDLSNPTYVRSLFSDGTIRLNKIVSVLYKGNKATVKITTNQGTNLVCTPDHEILTPAGFKAAETIKVGDILLTNGTLVCKNCGSDKNIITYKRAKFVGYCKTCMYRQLGENICIPKEDTVISIEQKKECNVYDIVVEDPARNFVANGIIVHNCGKTVQALEYLYIHPEMRPALIVCPASMKINWEREAKKWLPETDNIQVVNGKAITSGSSVVIINYDIVKKHEEAIKAMNFAVCVCDESHMLKNYKSQRTQKMQEIMSKIPHRILLTGTPILNRPSELYTQVNIISPGSFGTFIHFAQRYCAMRKTRFGMDTSGASNIPELSERLKTFTVRRLKKDVLTELPDKTRQTIEFAIDNREEYTKAYRDVVEYLREKKGDSSAQAASMAEMLVEIETLKQLAVKGKMASILDWIENFLESDQKLVIFATHTETIQAIAAKFPSLSVTLTGSNDQAARQNAIDQFQNNPNTRLFIGNLKAAGVGITLTAASNVAFVELGWTPSDMTQAEDRTHRIGQKNAVNIYYLLGKTTIDEKIAEMLTSKASTIDAIMDGKQAPELNILGALIGSLT